MKHILSVIAISVLILVFALPGAVIAAGTTSSKPASDSDYRKAEKAVDSGDYQTALTHLNRALEDDPKNADVHNLLGYSYRKLGNTAKAFEHYGIALELEPKHRGANEYLGELYLETGQLEKAEQRLEVLDQACFFGCEEYDELKEAIEAYKARTSG
ncbi:MAG: tetratricopeptide repeat protein [Desulfobacterales bacterium]|nr:tetratricopeptide repeat protein [Desulfobacterales bacterium]MCF8079783.1 tetratricopeptide repeat protein [Desulfobacterales bacterium]